MIIYRIWRYTEKERGYCMSEYQNYDDYVDEHEENEYDAIHGKKLTVGRVIKNIFKYGFRFVCIFVVGFLFFRIFMSNEPKNSKVFLWNETAINAYNEDPSSFTPKYYNHPDNITRDGKFLVSSVYFVPEIGQFQMTVRYSKSTLEKLVAEYTLDETPTNNIFVYTLTDQLGNTYKDYEFITFKKGRYTYERLIFDNIDMSPLTVKDADRNADQETKEKVQAEKDKVLLKLNVYYSDDVILSQPYGTLEVYDYDHYHEPFNFKKYMFKNNTPTDNLTDRINYVEKEEPEETE